MPATNATCEHSFSALRRVKTYPRATMGQERLNHVMLLHIHKARTDVLKTKLVDLANTFVMGSEHRKRIFGRFTSADLATSKSVSEIKPPRL